MIKVKKKPGRDGCLSHNAPVAGPLKEAAPHMHWKCPVTSINTDSQKEVDVRETSGEQRGSSMHLIEISGSTGKKLINK